MGVVRNRVIALIRDLIDGEITERQFKQRVRDLDSNTEGANWRTISLAAQVYMYDRFTGEEIYLIESLIIELYSPQKMEQVWADGTVERVHEY